MEEKTANMAENIRVTFTGFHYIKDDDYPNDFEVYLLILKDNSLSDRQGAALSMRTM